VDDEVAYFGGPVQPHLGTVLFRSEEPGWTAEGGTDVVPGISMSQHLGDLGHLATSPPGLFRLHLGYAGWGEGQLLEEFLRNDWMTAKVRPEFVFPPDPETVWERVLRSVGVDPVSLPSWTEEPEGGAPTN
jgi:putative transcriptional regulator